MVKRKEARAIQLRLVIPKRIGCFDNGISESEKRRIYLRLFSFVQKHSICFKIRRHCTFLQFLPIRTVFGFQASHRFFDGDFPQS